MICIALGLAVGNFFRSLGPAAKTGELESIEVRPGEGFREISRQLEERGIIRSDASFQIYALATGSATDLKAGEYQLAPTMSVPEIVQTLVSGENREVEVLIPEGASIYQVDKILSEARVTTKGAFLVYAKSQAEPVEGRLFPDTYRFYRDSEPADILEKMEDNFEEKTKGVLSSGEKGREELIVASYLEKEVPDGRDRRVVAGIIAKRLQEEMYLQLDASVCYVKQIQAGEYVPCAPITAADLKTNSKYNTYLYKGLTPGPIGSPGLDAIKAAQEPLQTAYWFYISDPETKETIFSRTLDEHSQNRVKYLKSNQ